MRESARILGKKYGLNSQEMNRILKKKGYLDGEPGNYSVTEKGAKYAEAKDYHRGPGGYPRYNREWTEITWDDSIEDELKITQAQKRAVRNEISEARRERMAAARVSRDEADRLFQSSRPDLFPDNADDISQSNAQDSGNGLSGLEVAGLVTLGAAVVSAVGYGLYKAAPHIRNWWNKKVKPFFGIDSDDSQEE